ncbi:hypothetical protein VRRI112168_00015 [Vreelandella rituensis]|uniref:Uncharacterized protein n=1 Tax=Vreelandella rituensis TaxID=2282306 RepID=A0A368UBC3_9GAMM|nr:hypothetical protein [Halomonas rituensis]RCV93917.1 hypothetical protein DU506_01790 [Halomonas rituensis]
MTDTFEAIIRNALARGGVIMTHIGVLGREDVDKLVLSEGLSRDEAINRLAQRAASNHQADAAA